MSDDELLALNYGEEYKYTFGFTTLTGDMERADMWKELQVARCTIDNYRKSEDQLEAKIVYLEQHIMNIGIGSLNLGTIIEDQKQELGFFRKELDKNDDLFKRYLEFKMEDDQEYQPSEDGGSPARKLGVNERMAKMFGTKLDLSETPCLPDRMTRTDTFKKIFSAEDF